MEDERYTKLVRSVGKKLIAKFEESHTVDAGINGPYDDPETPLRNLSHLAIIVSIEIRKFNNKGYLPLLQLIGDLLINGIDDTGIYPMRKKKGKDICNGVIGYSWLIEGFIYIYKGTGIQKYLDAAIGAAKKVPYVSTMHLWGRPGTNASNNIDYTLNHQLWYAASLCEMTKIVNDEDFHSQINDFMDHLSEVYQVRRNGRVVHSILKRENKLISAKQKLKLIADELQEALGRPSYKYKEEGYHLFNIMAIARIYSCSHGYEFFRSNQLGRSLDYVNSDAFFLGLLSKDVSKDSSLNNPRISEIEKTINIYGYPYNVPGFEIMYIRKVFPQHIDETVSSKCLSEQFEFTFNIDDMSFSLNCHDKATINYRVYEYYRYLEIVL